MLRKVVFGPLREPNHDTSHDSVHGEANERHGHVIRPIGWHEVAGLAPLMVLIVAIGVYPRPIFERISPAVKPYVDRFYVEPVQEPGFAGMTVNQADRGLMASTASPSGPIRIDFNGTDVSDLARVDLTRPGSGPRDRLSKPSRTRTAPDEQRRPLRLPADPDGPAARDPADPVGRCHHDGRCVHQHLATGVVNRLGRRSGRLPDRSVLGVAHQHRPHRLQRRHAERRHVRLRTPRSAAHGVGPDRPGTRSGGRWSGARVLRRDLADPCRRDDRDGCERTRVTVRRAGTGEHPDVPAALPSETNTGHPGSGDEILLSEHFQLGSVPVWPGVPLRVDGGEQPEGPFVHHARLRGRRRPSTVGLRV